MESDSKPLQSKEKTLKITKNVESVREEQEAGWPSFSQLILDLSKLALEGFTNVFSFNPFQVPKKGLTPLKDSLIMPEDEPGPLLQKHRTSGPVSEARQAHDPNEKYSETKPVKVRSLKDPLKHRASKREEYAEFYGSSGGGVGPHVRSKSQKERTKHRVRDKDKDKDKDKAVYGEQKSTVDLKQQPVNFEEGKFSYMRNKYGDSYRYT